jgi:hypothetical protein
MFFNKTKDKERRFAIQLSHLGDQTQKHKVKTDYSG